MYPGKHIVLWVRRRIRPLVGSALALVAAFWLGAQYGNGWRVRLVAPLQTTATPPSDLVSPENNAKSSTLDFSDLVPAACDFVPRNGEVLVRNVQTQQPWRYVKISNGSNGNAIVKVINADTRQLAASFFVAANQTASYDYLPDARYLVHYAFGDNLNGSCRAFIKTTAAEQFPDIDTLMADVRGVTYTLYAVPSGNVRPEKISIEAFEAE